MNRRGFLGRLTAAFGAITLGLPRLVVKKKTSIIAVTHVSKADIADFGRLYRYVRADRHVRRGDCVYWDDVVAGVAIADMRAGDCGFVIPPPAGLVIRG